MENKKEFRLEKFELQSDIENKIWKIEICLVQTGQELE